MDSIDNVYYNITINYENNPGGRAYFEENRTEIILPRCDNYYLTVQRFYVPMSLIPLMVAEIVPNQPDPNKMIYSVGLEYNGIYVQQYLNYVTDTLNVPIPLGPSFNPNGKQTKTNYYFIHSIQSLVNMFNTALSTAFSLIGAPVGAEAPYFIFDPSRGSFSIVCQTAYYDLSLLLPIKIYLNSSSYSLFIGLPLNKLQNNNIGKDYQIMVNNTKNDFYNPPFLAPTIPPNYFKIEQDFNSLSNWNSLISIVFTSNSIPIRSEQIPGADGEANSRPIITDFQPIFTQNGVLRDAAQFFPSGPYRLIDLCSTRELRKFDISVYWSDKNGYLYDLFIAPNETLNIKLLFVKKTIYNRK